jgi:hypothetical protein
MQVRYLVRMARFAHALVALLFSATLAALPASAAVNDVRSGANAVATASTGPTRFGGASLTVTISARIIRASARVGVDLGAPAPGMKPRQASVSAADGSQVPALVYDFE